MNLSDLKPAKGSLRRHTRLGRGTGSGLGKTSGRGHKGKGSRTGGNTPPGYEGGQMPLQRRVPKRGFRRLPKAERRREQFEIVNLRDLAQFGEGASIDPAAMVERGLLKPGLKVKILGDGELKIKLTVRADAFSQSAQNKIAQAGGTAELIQQPANQ